MSELFSAAGPRGDRTVARGWWLVASENEKKQILRASWSDALEDDNTRKPRTTSRCIGINSGCPYETLCAPRPRIEMAARTHSRSDFDVAFVGATFRLSADLDGGLSALFSSCHPRVHPTRMREGSASSPLHSPLSTSCDVPRHKFYLGLFGSVDESFSRAHP